MMALTSFHRYLQFGQIGLDRSRVAQPAASGSEVIRGILLGTVLGLIVWAFLVAGASFLLR